MPSARHQLLWFFCHTPMSNISEIITRMMLASPSYEDVRVFPHAAAAAVRVKPGQQTRVFLPSLRLFEGRLLCSTSSSTGHHRRASHTSGKDRALYIGCCLSTVGYYSWSPKHPAFLFSPCGRFGVSDTGDACSLLVRSLSLSLSLAHSLRFPGVATF